MPFFGMHGYYVNRRRKLMSTAAAKRQGSNFTKPKHYEKMQESGVGKLYINRSPDFP